MTSPEWEEASRLALELAEAKREIAALHRDALAEAQAYRAMFARAQEAEAKVDAARAVYSNCVQRLSSTQAVWNVAYTQDELAAALGIEL